MTSLALSEPLNVGVALVAKYGGTVGVSNDVNGTGAGELGARNTEQPRLSGDLGSTLGLGGTIDNTEVHASFDVLSAVHKRRLRDSSGLRLSIDKASELLAIGSCVDAVGSGMAGQLSLDGSSRAGTLGVNRIELLGSRRVGTAIGGDAGTGIFGSNRGGLELGIRDLALDRLAGLGGGSKSGTRQGQSTGSNSETTSKDGSALVERLRRGGSHLECIHAREGRKM